jgi:hypothetical protein
MTVDYRQHADDCRALANHMAVGEQRQQLLDMANAWDDLADTHPERRSEKAPDEVPQPPSP